MKKPSIKDIAKHLDVSVSAVSLTLNGKGDEKRISKETQKRIIDYAQSQHYQPNPFAKGLKNGHSDSIGLVVPNISDTFYARIARRIEKKAEQYGYNVVFSSTGESKEKERELIQAMLNRQVDGLIIASSQKNMPMIRQLKEMNFPFVLIDRYYPEIDTDYVICDNKGGVKSAVDYLLDLGISSIGYVSIIPELEVIKDRFRGYKETLESRGIAYVANYVRELSHDGYMQEMKAAFDHFQSLDVPVEAIVFATHYLAVEGLREMRHRGLHIPNDYKVISFDEHVTFDLIDPPITSVTQPVLEIGDKAVEILLEKLRNKTTSVTQVVMNTGFVSRKSCGE